EILDVSLQLRWGGTLMGVGYVAASYGLPIVTTDMTGGRNLRDILAQEVDGQTVYGVELVHLLDEGLDVSPDTDEAAQMVSDIISDYAKKGFDMGMANARGVQKYNPEALARAYHATFEQALGLNDPR